MVADGVLIADIVRHRAADFVDLIQSLGKECDSAGALGDDFERTPGTFGMLFVSQNPDRVDRRTVLFL
jgi:hypothetical protein